MDQRKPAAVDEASSAASGEASRKATTVGSGTDGQQHQDESGGSDQEKESVHWLIVDSAERFGTDEEGRWSAGRAGFAVELLAGIFSG